MDCLNHFIQDILINYIINQNIFQLIIDFLKLSNNFYPVLLYQFKKNKLQFGISQSTKVSIINNLIKELESLTDDNKINNAKRYKLRKQLNEHLIRRTKNNEIIAVERLISYTSTFDNWTVNIDQQGDKALLNAIQNNNLYMVMLLVDCHKLNINQTCANIYANNGQPFRQAIEYDDIDIFKYLESKSSGPISEHMVIDNLIVRAIKNGSLKSLKYLIDNNLYNNFDQYKAFTPLIKENKKLNTIKYLINNKTFINQERLENIFKFALNYCNPKLVKYLLNNGVDLNHIKNPFEEALRNDDQNCKFQMLKILIDYLGHDFDDYLTRNNINLLADISAYGNLEMFKYFVEKYNLDFQNLRPLMYAFNENKKDIIYYLINNGLEQQIIENSDNLYAAVSNGNLDITKFLLENYDYSDDILQVVKDVIEHYLHNYFINRRSTIKLLEYYKQIINILDYLIKTYNLRDQLTEEEITKYEDFNQHLSKFY